MPDFLFRSHQKNLTMTRSNFFIALTLMTMFFAGCEGDLADPITPTTQVESRSDLDAVTLFKPDRNGSVIFWSYEEDKNGQILVSIGRETKVIATPWTDKVGPDCKNYTGCALFSLPAGTYRYATVAAQNFSSVKGSFSVRPGECLKIQIVSKGTEPWSTEHKKDCAE
jgi:hypothetical protein